MTRATEWLHAKAPGFSQLTKKEQVAITDFSLLWSLFEGRVLSCDCNIHTIRSAVKSWNETGVLDPLLFDEEITYFQNRYYQNGAFTYHFDNLHLKAKNTLPMIRAVLSGEDNDTEHRISTALVVVYRYRNNLFHGVKWEYNLAGQLENFNHANSILIKALDRFQRCDEP
jgi:hypothetical protein